jgi:hypothetical protein
MTCPRVMSPIDLHPCRWPTVAGEPVATEELQERTTPDRRPSALTATHRSVGLVVLRSTLFRGNHRTVECLERMVDDRQRGRG